MTRVLITGGAGFIGSHIVESVLEAGLEPVVLDRRRPTVDVEHIRGDVRDPGVTQRATAGAELICHQAAMVGLGVDLADMPAYVAHNDLGTAVLLRALARERPRRLVVASSMAVYGEGRYRCARHGVMAAAPRSVEALRSGRFDPTCPQCREALTPAPIDEEAPPDPRNVYAATKLHQEHLAGSYARETGVPVTMLRYHNVYGPRMPRDTPYAGVAALFADALSAGRAPRVFEDGAQLRDFVHVRDVARANLLALTAADAVTGAFNVCSGTPRTVGDLARVLWVAAFPDAPEPAVTGEFRLGDVRHAFADPGRAARILGFRAHEDFTAGVTELAAALMEAA
ncbi:MAG: NAD-dependent epimerase/dehydratase family protein [Actinomycetota bacterium]|nr:NAD-dependent epimerase/dehydratase family protein [Actinomycetota bacterium]